MRILACLAATACVGGGPKETGDSGTTVETGTPTSDPCVFDLDLWCFNREYPPGPSQTTGTCPTVTVDGLMDSGATGFLAPTHLQCTDPLLGTLDVVNQPTGFGGPVWYFDAGGDLVAYQYSTDYSLCDGPDGSLHYGAVPDCTTWCEVEDPNDWYAYPPC